MTNGLPYRESFRQSWQLTRQYGDTWLFAMAATAFLAYLICPSDLVLKNMAEKDKAERAELSALVKKNEQLQTTLEFANKKDPFFTERLLREEFNLKRISPPTED
jgi:hypothetical protein